MASPYRIVVAADLPWWRRLLCRLNLHRLELDYIEDTRMCDIWHHRCVCGETSEVHDI